MMEAHLIEFHIAESGQRHYLLNPTEAVEMMQQHNAPGVWIYADGQMIQADLVNENNLSTTIYVHILPGLVGGTILSPQVGEEE
jgi:hypothetical protein